MNGVFKFFEYLFRRGMVMGTEHRSINHRFLMRYAHSVLSAFAAKRCESISLAFNCHIVLNKELLGNCQDKFGYFNIESAASEAITELHCGF